MKIEQLRNYRNALEHDLRAMIVERVGYFKEATGCSPRNIDVRMVDVTKIGDSQPDYIVGRVDVEIKL